MLRQLRILAVKRELYPVVIFVVCFVIVFCMNFLGFAQAATKQSGLKYLNQAALLYCDKNHGSVNAVFWTRKPDGSQILETRFISDDAVTGFLNYSMPAWHLNEGLSLFFQMPVYERQLGSLSHFTVRVPV